MTPQAIAGTSARRCPRREAASRRRCLRGGCSRSGARRPLAPSTKRKPTTPKATAGGATRACRRHDTAPAGRGGGERVTACRAGQRPAARFRRPTRFSCREQDVSASSKRRKLARRRPLDLMKGDLDYSKFTLPRVHFYADRKTASTSN